MTVQRRILLMFAILLCPALVTTGCSSHDSSVGTGENCGCPETDAGDYDSTRDADLLEPNELDGDEDLSTETGSHFDTLQEIEDIPQNEAEPRLPCPSKEAHVVHDVSVRELHDEIQSNADLAVVDVREPSETASGIIHGALLYPWISGVLEQEHESLPGGVRLYVICASGGRSPAAASFLVSNGHTCVHNVLGGMNAWKSAGYPVEAP